MWWDFCTAAVQRDAPLIDLQCKAWGDLQGQALTLRRESYGSLQVAGFAIRVAAVCRKQFGEQPQTIKIYLNPIPSARPFSNQGFKRADLVTWHALSCPPSQICSQLPAKYLSSAPPHQQLHHSPIFCSLLPPPLISLVLQPPSSNQQAGVPY